MLKHLRSDTASGRTMIFLGVAAACIYWFGAGIEHSFTHNNGDISEALFPSDVPDLIIRLFVVGTAVGFSFYTRSLINKLLAVHKQYKTLFENAPDAIVIADVTTGIITGANPAAEKLLLRSYDKIVGLHQSKLHPPKKRDDSTTIFLRQVEDSKEGKKARAAEHVILRSDGVEVPVEIMAKTVDLGDRTVLQGVFRDVTERKRIENALRESEQRFRAIFNNLADGVLLVDVNTRKFRTGNSKICEMLGYDQEELRNLGPVDVHPEQDLDQAMDQFEKVVRREITIAEELPIRRKDGSILYADINTFPLKVGGREYLTGVFRDVTERKEAEEKLKQSEERFRLAMDVTDDALWDWDLTTNEVYRNPRHATMLGYDTSELSGSHEEFKKWIHPDDKDLLFGLIHEYLNGRREPFNIEYRMLRKSGDFIWVLGRGKVVASDEDGLPLRMVGTNIDITQRKLMEEALRHSEELYRSVVEDSPLLLCRFLPDGQITFVNDAYCEYFGKNREELMGESFTMLIPEKDRSAVLDNILLLKPGLSVMTHEHQVIADGQIRWQRWTNRAIFDDQGRAVCFQSFGEDTTERIRAQQALQESEEKYRTLVEGAGAAISTVNEDGVFLFMNEFAARLLGGKPQDYVGKTMWDLFPKEIADRQVDSVLKVIRSGSGMNVASLTLVQNEPRWYSTSLEPIRSTSSEFTSVMVIARDITDHRKAEEQLEVYRSEMVRTERLASMGTVSAMAAHELTQPLTVIQLLIQNAIDELHEGPSSESVRNKLTGCLREVSTITSIVNRFRNFARRSSGQSTSEVDLQVVGEKIVGLLSAISRRRGVSLLLIDLEKLPHIHTSEKDIEQIFFALIDNAIQAKDNNENCQITVSGRVKDHHVELIFSDNSGGIAPENLDRIFEPFFTTKPEDQGTGLGLTIVREILSRLGGKVDVESNFGEGSKFIITLPIKK